MCNICKSSLSVFKKKKRRFWGTLIKKLKNLKCTYTSHPPLQEYKDFIKCCVLFIQLRYFIGSAVSISFYFLHRSWTVMIDTRRDWVVFSIFFLTLVCDRHSSQLGEVCSCSIQPLNCILGMTRWRGQPTKGCVRNTPFIAVFLPLCFLTWPPLPAQPL